MDVAVEHVACDEQEHVLPAVRQPPVDRRVTTTKKTMKSGLWKITGRLCLIRDTNSSV